MVGVAAAIAGAQRALDQRGQRLKALNEKLGAFCQVAQTQAKLAITLTASRVHSWEGFTKALERKIGALQALLTADLSNSVDQENPEVKLICCLFAIEQYLEKAQEYLDKKDGGQYKTKREKEYETRLKELAEFAKKQDNLLVQHGGAINKLFPSSANTSIAALPATDSTSLRASATTVRNYGSTTSTTTTAATPLPSMAAAAASQSVIYPPSKREKTSCLPCCGSDSTERPSAYHCIQ